MIESIDELKAQVQEWLERLPRPEDCTDYARGEAFAYNEVLRAVTPEPRTAEVVVTEVVKDRSVARRVLKRLAQEGFMGA